MRGGKGRAGPSLSLSFSLLRIYPIRKEGPLSFRKIQIPLDIVHQLLRISLLSFSDIVPPQFLPYRKDEPLSFSKVKILPLIHFSLLFTHLREIQPPLNLPPRNPPRPSPFVHFSNPEVISTYTQSPSPQNQPPQNLPPHYLTLCYGENSLNIYI